LLETVDELNDDELRAPSALPGWTRAHVVGHLARNAEALARLGAWACTGFENPMYATPEQRAREIEESAEAPAAFLRSGLATTAVELDRVLGALTEEQWRAPVRSALGREIPAAEIPWMRIREVWLHAVDLAAGADLHDLPGGVVDLLIDDVAGALSSKDGCPEAVLAPSDRDRRWRLGSNPQNLDAPEVTAPAASIAGWLTGRIPPACVLAPPVPGWI
jgi:maleylpyruvate isomerase